MGKTGKDSSMFRRFLAFFLLFLPLACPVFGAETDGYPIIDRLDARDAGFKQYSADVEYNRRKLFGGQNQRNPEIGEAARATALAESLTIYRYAPVDGDDLFSLASRCNVPYATLASLNRLENTAALFGKGSLLLPSCPGIFLPAEPKSELEQLLAATRTAANDVKAVKMNIRLNGGKAETFYFYPGADFNPTERLFFLNPGFRFPLKQYRITSNFGMRQSPITGKTQAHSGIDLAAPMGTEVFAVREGVVTEIGLDDPVYGKYIVIKHGERWASLYGHLQSIHIDLRMTVQSGTLIGKVGSTGMSTGPHLHFELRENGQARDPGKFLFQGSARQ